jgi:DNA-binding NtrC family response regulator
MQIWRCIIGRSTPVAELRASVWESIFTVHPERFLTSLYRCLSAWPTLVIGPSGSGKGLVAQAIGLSRYCEFDKTMLTFPDYSPDAVYPINLAATSTSRLEEEIFGSCSGSMHDPTGGFDGALTRCGRAGTVFLDGINDADTPIQVKLLRVLETRRFLPVGATEARTFNGKIISASDRNLEEKVERGDFREDFYFRLCGDIIVTPSLREQLSDHPDDLTLLVRFILERELDCSITEDEKSELTGEISGWINQHLGHQYHWPGNMRELEQCVRNILFHGKYRPMKRPPRSAIRKFLDSVANGAFDLDELKRAYITLMFALTRHKYSETGLRLRVDPRTVKKLIDWDLLRGFDADLGN